MHGYETSHGVDRHHRVESGQPFESGNRLVIVKKLFGRNREQHRIVCRIVTAFGQHLGESAVVGNTHHAVGQVARHGNRRKGVLAVLQHGFEPGLFFLTAIQGDNGGIAQ